MLKLSVTFLLVALAVHASARPSIVPYHNHFENYLENALEDEFENELESAQPIPSKNMMVADQNKDYDVDEPVDRPQDVAVVNEDSDEVNDDNESYIEELNKLLESIKAHIAELREKVSLKKSLITNEA